MLAGLYSGLHTKYYRCEVLEGELPGPAFYTALKN
jgi:hypothetical protein